MRIEDVDLRVGDRPSDREAARAALALPLIQPEGERADGGLGRSVVVEDAAARIERCDPIEQRRAQRLPTHDQILSGQQLARLRAAEQGLQVRGHDLEHIDP